MKYFKAFNKGMKCRGKQYKENTVYEENGGEICGRGMMHFCETPFDTLNYYPLVDENGDLSEFAEIEPLDEVVKRKNKCASKKIRIGEKLSFEQFIQAGVDALIEKTKTEGGNMSSNNYKHFALISSSGASARISSFGYGAHISSSGNDAQIGSSGDGTQISSSGKGTCIGSSGYDAQISSSGNGAYIGSFGYGAYISSSGYDAQIGSSGYGAQISSSGDGTCIGSSGYGAQISSSGASAQICSLGARAQISSSGDNVQITLKGERSVAAAVGYNGMIKGKKGDWIVLTEWKRDDTVGWYPACVKSGQIDGDLLKEDTFYYLKDGEFNAYL